MIVAECEISVAMCESELATLNWHSDLKASVESVSEAKLTGMIFKDL